MRQILFALLVLTLPLAAPSFADDGDATAIREVIQTAYVQGIHNEQDPEKIRRGFHESFVMFIQTEEGVRQVTRDDWIQRIEASKANRDRQARPPVTAEVKILDRSGHAAVAKVEVFREGKQIFTDYMSLYKGSEGWKLVGKIFFSHP